MTSRLQTDVSSELRRRHGNAAVRVENNPKDVSVVSTNQSKNKKKEEAPEKHARPTTRRHLVEASVLDRIFPIAAAISIVVWLLLLVMVYTLTPAHYPRIYLKREEREAAMAAFCIMLVATLLLIMPFLFGRSSLAPGRDGRKSNLSGIVIAALAVQLVSCATNAILAFGPNLVIVDPVTHAPVYLTRWCEWIPLAGLMTFLSETMDLEKKAASTSSSSSIKRQWHPLFMPTLSSLSQTLSCVQGLIFPFSYGVWDWSFYMFLAFVLYLSIFPRVWMRWDYLQLRNAPGRASSAVGSATQQQSVTQMEEAERRRASANLITACSIVWTVLVVMYFLNMMAYRLLSPDHPLRRYTSLAMFCDTFFDVLAKSIYMKIIVAIHSSVFDEDGRAHRQLKELRQLMSVFWEDCSDVIVISVQKDHAHYSGSGGGFSAFGGAPPSLTDEYGNPCVMYTTMFSSSFPPWIVEETELRDNHQQVVNRKSACLTLEIRAPIIAKSKSATVPKHVVVAAYFVDSNFLPGTGDIEPAILCSQDVNSLLVQEAASVSSFVWQSIDEMDDSRSTGSNRSNTVTTMHPIRKHNGEQCFCESKVSRHTGGSDDGGDGNGCKSLVAVVRDVTERVRRLEAEQRAHAETLARQRDAQSVNRFTRHEVKNGLLAGIELCDSLRVLVEKNSSAGTDLQSLTSTHQNTGEGSTSSDIPTAVTRVSKDDKIEHDESASVGASISENPQASPIETASPYDSFRRGVLKQVDDLDKALHDVLETVLTEAAARDVIHEVYKPQLVPINVEETLTGSTVGIGGSERFPLIVPGNKCSNSSSSSFGDDRSTIPTVQMDTQLLCYIHRNAVSNACKYGRSGGIVKTIIQYNDDTQELELQVINEPGHGHERLLAMGESASDAVFEQGKRLDTHLEGSDKRISFGDGAWIMEKCAKALGGTCQIKFETTQTIVTFKCPATPVTSDVAMFRKFQVPSDTFGLALDDSKIQRKILGRILSQVGVERSRLIVVGKTPAEVDEFSSQLMTLLQEHKDAKFLILVDEILDYSNIPGNNDVGQLSGSRVMKEILDSMTPEQERRVLALVRSANDSQNDIKQYLELTHGFFSKSPTQGDRVRETLAPLWLSRFDKKSNDDEVEDGDSSLVHPSSEDDDDDDSEISGSELLESLKTVEDLLDRMPTPPTNDNWPRLWRALHSLRGDLMMVEGNDDLEAASLLIHQLRGPHLPSNFATKWGNIQSTIQVGASNL